jgi:hypothetical protein
MGTIKIERKWEYKAANHADSSTVGTFSIDDNTLTGYILEPGGDSTAQSGQDRRIPPGTYDLTWHTSVKFPKDKYQVRGQGRYLENGFPKLYSDDVSKDRGILIHIGNDGDDTQGCLLPGSGVTKQTVEGKECVTAVTGSTATFYALMDYIEGQGIENVKIEISENFI